MCLAQYDPLQFISQGQGHLATKRKAKSVKKIHHMTVKAKQRKADDAKTIAFNSKFTPERANAFCHVLASTCNVGKAAESIGVSRHTVYDWREDFPEFAKAWDAAKKIGITVLEDEAVRRGGNDGIDEPVFYQGEKVATVKKHSDTLLTFLLSAHKGEVYGRQRLEHTGAEGQPLIPSTVRVTFVKAKK